VFAASALVALAHAAPLAALGFALVGVALRGLPRFVLRTFNGRRLAAA